MIGVRSFSFSLGVPTSDADGAPVPAPLVAVTEHAYATAGVNPFTVIGVPLPLAVRVACPEAEQLAV